MTRSFLPADDLPPVKATLLDEILMRQLAEAIGRHFYQSCASTVRVLLSYCHWYFKANSYPITLVIFCYDIESYWHIINVIPLIVNSLKQFSNSAKIHLSPPANMGVPWDVAVDEISNDED
ncbi:hypothetical protein G7B40_022525 [Aetokthonos hydrillicola Thurmond2011]|jgi:hypothetical protein|uniref:Uncharacterized protein n=1 Tax=Aetokthonos hydrillicola Thurmond2011 TaxID=2712845 RepID=A0AAP5M9K4_9CYAN|nr:hypothetical protein [Aetokthonos hydrillicola]MBW4588816.1 hypothetical protein [Aetokthonos hydrillicola CCALA 1050]MDR9897320.1 hypothetical protein [Aetokthonos hydrillicola Thurmond2011]